MNSIRWPHLSKQFSGKVAHPRFFSGQKSINLFQSTQFIRRKPVAYRVSNYHAITPRRCGCGRRTFATSGTSYSVDDCPNRAFAKEHPEAARRVLSVPPSFSSTDSLLSSSPPNSFMTAMEKDDGNSMQRDYESLEGYLQWRGWDIERMLHEFKLLGNDEDDLMVHSAVGLLSHPLTFPLTLGRHIKAFSPPSLSSQDSDNVDGDGIKQHHLRLCCVGARAECTLPDDYWREFLLVAAMTINQACHENDKNQQIEQSFHCTIDFVGPDVPSHLKSKTIALLEDNDNDDGCQEHVLTMNYHKSFLHEVVLKFLKSSHNSTADNTNISRSNNGDGNIQSSDTRIERIQQFWDGYVLFNPGLGHPNLQKQWGPTLKFLVGTKKPILFTAHSPIDAERDRVVLEELLVDAGNHPNGGSVEYDINPYASRMGFVDPFSTSSAADDEGTNKKVHVVRPNHSVFLLE